MKGAKLPEELVNEAKKLRMEGGTYREIAAKLNLRSPSSLQPHLKGIPKGRRGGTAVIEVPVDHGQRVAEEKAHRAETTETVEWSKTIAEALLEVARAEQKLVQELEAERETRGTQPHAGIYDTFTLQQREAIKDRLDKLEKVAAERKDALEAFEALVTKVNGLESIDAGLIGNQGALAKRVSDLEVIVAGLAMR
ncbi:MAG: hypothetical protein ABSG92_00535 [Conexivisphaerales archaeon]